MSWKSEHETYGIAIHNYDQSRPYSLKLWRGDLIKIIESNQDWFRGNKLNDENKIGVFPKSFIMINDKKRNNDSSLIAEITITIKKWFVCWKQLYKENKLNHFTMIKMMIYLLIDSRKQLLSINLTNDECNNIKDIILAHIDLGNGILGLPIVMRDELGILINLDTINIISLLNIHVKESIYLKNQIKFINENNQILCNNGLSNMEQFKFLKNFKKFPTKTRAKEFELDKRTHSYNLLINLVNIVCDKFYEAHCTNIDADVIMALYDAKELRFFTENFHIKWCGNNDRFRTSLNITTLNKTHRIDDESKSLVDIVSNDNSYLLEGDFRKDKTYKGIFMDLGRKDLTREKIYLVCQIIRKGVMEMKDGDIKKLTTDIRRPYVVAALEITDYINGTLFCDGETQHFVPFLQCTDKESIETVIRKAIHAKEINHKGQGFWVSVRLLNEDIEETQYDNVVKIQKMGFPDIIMPGDFRNDLYITLQQGEFSRYIMGKVLDKNIEVAISLHDNSGCLIQGVFTIGATCTQPFDTYKSAVYYHEDKPKWAESLKITIPIEIFYECHIRFTFKHRCSNEAKDRNEKPFAISFLKLVDHLQTAINDGSHNLLIYKIDHKKYDPSKVDYLELPYIHEHLINTTTSDIKNSGSRFNFVNTKYELDNILPKNTQSPTIKKPKAPTSPSFSSNIEHDYTSNPALNGYLTALDGSERKCGLTLSLKDSFRICSLLCSTKLTQNEDLLGLLAWKSNPTNKALEKILSALPKIRGEEIVKYLPDTLDALFGILVSNQGNYTEFENAKNSQNKISDSMFECSNKDFYDILGVKEDKNEIGNDDDRSLYIPNNDIDVKESAVKRNFSTNESDVTKRHPTTEIQSMDLLVFDSLVFIISLVSDRKYMYFKSVLDIYIKENFSSTLIHRKLIKILIAYIEAGIQSPSPNFSKSNLNKSHSFNHASEMEKSNVTESFDENNTRVKVLRNISHDSLLKIMKCLEYLIRFSIRSFLLYSALNSEMCDYESFSGDIKCLLNALAQFMSIGNPIALSDEINITSSDSQRCGSVNEPNYGSKLELVALSSHYDTSLISSDSISIKIRKEENADFSSFQINQFNRFSAQSQTSLRFFSSSKNEANDENKLFLAKALLIQASILKYLPVAIGEIFKIYRDTYDLTFRLLSVLKSLPLTTLRRQRLDFYVILMNQDSEGECQLLNDRRAFGLFLSQEIIPLALNTIEYKSSSIDGREFNEEYDGFFKDSDCLSKLLNRTLEILSKKYEHDEKFFYSLFILDRSESLEFNPNEINLFKEKVKLLEHNDAMTWARIHSSIVIRVIVPYLESYNVKNTNLPGKMDLFRQYLVIALGMMHLTTEQHFNLLIDNIITSKNLSADFNMLNYLANLVDLTDFLAEIMCTILTIYIPSYFLNNDEVFDNNFPFPQEWVSIYYKTDFICLKILVMISKTVQKWYTAIPYSFKNEISTPNLSQNTENSSETLFLMFLKPTWELLFHAFLSFLSHHYTSLIQNISENDEYINDHPATLDTNHTLIVATQEIYNLWKAIPTHLKPYFIIDKGIMDYMLTVTIIANHFEIREILITIFYDVLRLTSQNTSSLNFYTSRSSFIFNSQSSTCFDQNNSGAAFMGWNDNRLDLDAKTTLDSYFKRSFFETIENTLETDGYINFRAFKALILNFRASFRQTIQHELSREPRDFANHDSTILYLDTVDKLIDLLLEYHSCKISSKSNSGLIDELCISKRKIPIISDSESQCLVDLMQFNKDMGRIKAYTHFLDKLVILHISQEDFGEAGFALKLKADLLDWSENEYGEIKDHDEKVELYRTVIDYFTKGKLWEPAINMCNEILSYYGTINAFNYSQISRWHHVVASLYDSILTQLRPEIEYYRVAYIGNGYTSRTHKNKCYVYRGKPFERLSEFIHRMQEIKPDAKLVTTADLSISSEMMNSNEKYLHINKVTPINKQNYIFDQKLIPEQIISYYKTNEVQEFEYTRPIIKAEAGVKGETDFANIWVEKTYLLTSHSFPGILRFSPIYHSHTVLLSPLDNAIEIMEETNKKLKAGVKHHLLHDNVVVDDGKLSTIDNSKRLSSPNNPSSINTLSLLLNGIVDPAVMGGIANYEKAFLNEEYYRAHPMEEEKIRKLKTLILSQIPLLEMGIVIHGIKSHESLKLFHQRMEECFLKHKQHILEHYSGIKAPNDLIVSALRLLLLKTYTKDPCESYRNVSPLLDSCLGTIEINSQNIVNQHFSPLSCYSPNRNRHYFQRISTQSNIRAFAKPNDDQMPPFSPIVYNHNPSNFCFSNLSNFKNKNIKNSKALIRVRSTGKKLLNNLTILSNNMADSSIQLDNHQLKTPLNQTENINFIENEKINVNNLDIFNDIVTTEWYDQELRKTYYDINTMKIVLREQALLNIPTSPHDQPIAKRNIRDLQRFHSTPTCKSLDVINHTLPKRQYSSHPIPRNDISNDKNDHNTLLEVPVTDYLSPPIPSKSKSSKRESPHIIDQILTNSFDQLKINGCQNHMFNKISFHSNLNNDNITSDIKNLNIDSKNNIPCQNGMQLESNMKLLNNTQNDQINKYSIKDLKKIFDI
ncbi:uncharacterized protein LOC135927606 isoform X2 [Gordionus sp. m RMFG-2023]|uniref:uncharacterized protein LOC135927606 isoform X2 n=1 Tax=Gordionus sp. m RMFG-2023 TaxID=3053472 RepID=UPI0031FC5D2D